MARYKEREIVWAPAMFFLLRCAFWLMIVYSSIFKIDVAAPWTSGQVDLGAIAAGAARLGSRAPALCESAAAACAAAAGAAVKLATDRLGESLQDVPLPPVRHPSSTDTLKAADRDLLPPRRPARS